MTQKTLSFFLPLTEDEKLLEQGSIPNSFTEEGPYTVRNTLLPGDRTLIAIRRHFRFFHMIPHNHEFIEMAYVLQGNLEHHIEGKRVVLTPGSLLILNRTVRHSIEACGKEDIMINFLIKPEFFDRTLDYSDMENSPIRRFFLDCILGRDNTPEYLLFNVSGITPIENLLENLILSLIDKPPYKNNINQMTMALLLCLLQFHTESVASDQEETDIIWRLQKYIDLHYKDGNLRDAAALLNYDYRWLSHMIVQKTGKTFTELLQLRKLQQAVYYLENTDYSVADICARIGYTNLSYFYRLFRKAHGLTPKEFRDAKRKPDEETPT